MFNRKPGFVSYKDLQPGDIIILRSPRGLPWYQKIPVSLYYLYQSMVSQKHGHYDNTHAAICTEVIYGWVQIAHVVGSGYEIFTANEKSMPGPFWVFRPKNLWIAQKTAQIAASYEDLNHLKWSGWEALQTLITRAKNKDELVDEQKYISETTICSKFILQVMQEAASNSHPDVGFQDNIDLELRKEYFPTINANSLPKTLESYLFHNDNYEYFVYPGEQPYDFVNKAIAIELKRISDRNDALSCKKFNDACAEFKAVHQAVAEDNHSSELEKTIFLVNAMLPHLAIKTHYSLGETTSVTHVLAAAREVGLFRRDFSSLNRVVEEEIGEQKVKLK